MQTYMMFATKRLKLFISSAEQSDGLDFEWLKLGKVISPEMFSATSYELS
jgi:hypothetical protein